MPEPTGDAPAPHPLAGGDVPDPFPGSLRLPATGREVAQFVALRAAACVGADYSNLALLNADAPSLRLFHHSFLDSAIAERYIDVPLDAQNPIAVAARAGRVVLLPTIESYDEEFSEIKSDTIAAGVQATASLPLYRADGRLLGAIGFAWTEPTSFDRKLEAALRAVAELCVETVERAERYDAEHELVLELQTRLIGVLPDLAGVATAARYRPANSESALGGDWYEGLLLGDSRLAVVVGDVTGHGITAAADMALLRGMMSALLHSGVTPSRVFGEVSGVIAQRTALLLATAALAIVDRSAETLTFVTAGHPPPLLRLPDGKVRLLDTANGSMIGIPSRPGVAETVPFPLGSQLVMFTDGLVERRDRPFSLGVEQAARHLEGVGALSPIELVDSMLDALVGDAPAHDDIVVLVVESSA